MLDIDLTAQSVGHDFVWSQLIRGVAQMLAMMPLNQASMAAVSREDSGDAAGLYNMARNLGGSVGLAIIGTVIDRRTTFHTAMIRESLTANSLIGQERLAASAANWFAQTGDMAYSQDARARPDRARRSSMQAIVMTYSETFYLLGIALLACMPLALLLKTPRGTRCAVRRPLTTNVTIHDAVRPTVPRVSALAAARCCLRHCRAAPSAPIITVRRRSRTDARSSATFVRTPAAGMVSTRAPSQWWLALNDPQLNDADRRRVRAQSRPACGASTSARSARAIAAATCGRIAESLCRCCRVAHARAQPEFAVVIAGSSGSSIVVRRRTAAALYRGFRCLVGDRSVRRHATRGRSRFGGSGCGRRRSRRHAGVARRRSRAGLC